MTDCSSARRPDRSVGVTGNVSILNSSISGNAHNSVHIRNTSGTIAS